MGASLSTEATTVAEARRLVCALAPPPESSSERGGWVRRLAALTARAAAWAVLVAQYLLAYGSIGHILHVLVAHPADFSSSLLLLAPLVILLTWALRAAVVLAAGRSPAEWEARWVAPTEAAAVVAAAAASAIDPLPPAAVELKVAVERGRQADDATPVSVWRSQLPTVRMRGGGLATGWPPVLPRVAAPAVTPGRPPSSAAAAASRPPRPPPRAPRSPLLPPAGPPRVVAYGATALALGTATGPRLDAPPGSHGPAAPPTAPAGTSAMAAVRRWVRRSRGGAAPPAPLVPIRLVIRHRLRWADGPTAAAATAAVTAGLAASADWASQLGNHRHYRAASLGVDPTLPDDEYLLVEPAGPVGGRPPVFRWALGPAAYLAAEATLVPWAYWLTAALLSRRVEVVVDHLLVRGAPGEGDDSGRAGVVVDHLLVRGAPEGVDNSAAGAEDTRP